jgi:hypothetical protein
MAKDRNTSGGILDMLGSASRRAEGKKAAPQAGTLEAETPKAPRQDELPGTELSIMAEKQEGLLERVLSRSGTPGDDEAKKELAALQGVLTGLSQKTVVVIFAMGKILSEVKEALNHGEFMPWVEANCPFSRMTTSSYMRVYERYKDEPRKALEELSITEAYLEAGVKKLAAPEGGEEIHGKGGVSLDGEPRPEEFAGLFKKPTLSGALLKHYRVAPYQDGTLYVVRPEIGVMPVCNLFVNMAINEPAYQAAVTKAHQNLQIALETFYAAVEELEDQGAIPTPFDSSRGAMIKRMRNVTPQAASGKVQAKAGGHRGTTARKGGRK